MKKFFSQFPLLFLGAIICLAFAYQALTAKGPSEHRILNFDEEVLLQASGSSRVDLICNETKFQLALGWNEALQQGTELTFSDLVQRGYPEPLLTRLDEECAGHYRTRTMDKILYGAVALALAGYVFWGVRTNRRTP